MRKSIRAIVFTSITVSCLATAAQELTPRQQLERQSKQFEKTIIKLADGAYTAVGHSGSNVSMVVGRDGVIIVDTTPSTSAAQGIRSEFRKLSDQPVAAIIYTHGHRDHVGGASVFADRDEPQIYARDNFRPLLRGQKQLLGPIIDERSVRQFGRKLKPHTERINLGVAPAVNPTKGFGAGYLPPTKSFSEQRLSVEIAGIRVELVQAPGETDDQLYVWLPKQKILFSGDNFYQAFPNLYAIRGTPYRDVRKWSDSLDEMVNEGAEVLVPGHTRPIFGAKSVQQALSDYRDAIRFVHDKTVEGMNKGLTPDELVGYVKLPKHLATRSYLIEFYGRVDWAVRSVYSGYLGWFDGNPSNLRPLQPTEEAKRIAEMVGGPTALLREAEVAAAIGQHQWVLQLTDHLRQLDAHGAKAKKLRFDALVALAEQQVNAPARNYYLSSARELRAGN